MTPDLRAPRPGDGADIHDLVREIGTLDLNSSYAYLMLARNFADTSVVADVDGDLVGFVTGYRVPDDPSALFVWQVGVAPGARGNGIATAMLDWLVDTGDVRHLHATVGPDNTASQRLFRSVAEAHDARVQVTPWLDADDFPEDDHDPEHLFRIGPLTGAESTEDRPVPTGIADLDRHRRPASPPDSALADSA